MKTALRMALMALGAMILLVGCKREHPIDGIGAYRFGKTTLKDWGYACQKNENGTTWCQNNPLEPRHNLDLGGQTGYLGALFGGTTDDAPLVELELYVNGCNTESLSSWLEREFGGPTERTEGASFWKKKLIFIAALLPTTGSECKVNFVEAKNAERIEKLRNRK